MMLSIHILRKMSISASSNRLASRKMKEISSEEKIEEFFFAMHLTLASRKKQRGKKKNVFPILFDGNKLNAIQTRLGVHNFPCLLPIIDS